MLFHAQSRLFVSGSGFSSIGTILYPVYLLWFDFNITLGKDTIRKKIVKRILSPITILRSVSEEEKTINDHPQIASPGYEGKSNDALVEARPKKLLDMNPLYLAQELCLIDKELLVRIPWNELSTCGWMTKHKVQYIDVARVASVVKTHRRKII